MFQVKNLSFSYRLGTQSVEVLKDLNFSISRGDFVAIQGPSGSGKSTLFYILGLLLKPTEGQILFDGLDIHKLTSDQMTYLRNNKIGFIFQQFHLLAKTNALENILLPTRYPCETAVPSPLHRKKAIALAKLLGIEKHLSHLPNQLSGGQQQRVAIARALMNDVDLILADEPTGNLDSRTAKETLELLRELNQQGKTIILITHDSGVAEFCEKKFYMKDGELTGPGKSNTSKKSSSTTHRGEGSFGPPQGPVPSTERPALAEAQAYSSTSIRLTPQSYRNILRATFPLVTENLIRNKTKSLLTMMGVVIGVSAVLAMVTLGQFTKRKILETYESLGVNKILIRGYPNWNLKATDSPPVSFKSFDWKKDFVPLRRLFPEIRAMAPSLDNWNLRATAGGLTTDKISAIGTNYEYLRITNRSLIVGRNISPYHLESRSPVCVIGFEVAERLLKRTNPIGQIITLSDRGAEDYPCQVIGVLSTVTSNKDFDPPNLNVILPYTYFQTVTAGWGASLHQVSLQTSADVDVEKVGIKIKNYFIKKYGKSGLFMVDSDSTLIAQMKKFLNLFAILLTAIAFLSLLVGGIGINNMMLVSVTERIKEFGIRKALGATDRSIRAQVLMESIALCALAGLIGVLLGFTAYELLIFGATRFVPNMKFEWIFEPTAVILSLVSILAVGIASGFIPALRAEKLQVIEALRAE